MCVIIVCQDKAPTEDILNLCAEKNPHGAGIAWRDGDKVCWEKGLGLKVDQVLARIKTIKLPYIVHFRIASVGNVCGELNHPFPFGGADTRLFGATKHGVLFHNGTFHQWKSELKDMCRATGRRLPDGRWSDSRAMACLAGAYGGSYLHLIDERIAYMTPTDVEILGTMNQGWCHLGLDMKPVKDHERGLWFSNDLWLPEKKTAMGYTVGTGRSGTSPDPVVGSFAGRGGHGGWNARQATPPTPWKKPTECGHDGSSHYMDNRRFCTECGIRLDAVKNEPWIVIPAEKHIRTEEAVTEAANKPNHKANIAERVKRLCLHSAVQQTSPPVEQMH